MNIIFILLLAIAFSSCGGGGGGGGSASLSPNDDSTSPDPEATPKYSDEQEDSLASYLWFFKSNGQSNFTDEIALEGSDINLGNTHDSYRGQDVKVVVADGRIDLDHPDLVGNTDLSLSKNYTAGNDIGNDPTSDDVEDAHGTLVMGLIGSLRGNGKGGYGVAPLTKLIGYNFLDSDQSLSKKNDQVTSLFAGIYNFSFGYITCSVNKEDKLYYDYLKFNSDYSSVYVTAAGNDFSGDNSDCQGDGDIYLGNSNLDQVKTFPQMIVVASTNSQKFSSNFSTPGSNIWISAPGGEDEDKLNLISTDLVGCDKGYAKSSSTNILDKNQNNLNENCSYATGSVKGTSFSAPLVTGAVALLKEACSSCNFRDFKHILVSSAKKIDPTSGNSEHPIANLNLSGHVYQQGWVENDAGYSFHNWYGFGLLNVEDAVTLAQNKEFSLYDAVYTEIPQGMYYSSGTLNSPIPDNTATGVSSTINVTDHDLVIENVLIKLTINHTFSSDLGVELTSPSGTKSILMNINSKNTETNLADVLFGSNAFYFEKTKGNWTLKIIDGALQETGTLVSWGIEFLGNRGHENVETVEPPTNISNTGNTISWSASIDTNISRYEVCIDHTENSICRDYEWFPIGNVNSYDVTQYRIISWSTISSGSTYYFNIRAIDSNENVSEVQQYSWVAQ